MGYIEQTKVLAEYLNFLRNSDILTTTVRGVTTTSDTKTTAATGAETFTLTNLGVKNIRSITYDGSTIYNVKDYTINLDSNQVTLLSVVPGKTVVISYDYGKGDRIYPDYPRTDISISKFPRIGFGIYGFRSEVAGFGNVLKSTWRFDVRVYATSQKQADELTDSIRSKNIAAYVSLNYCNRIYPEATRDLGLMELEKGKDKIYVKGLDIIVINDYEIN